MATAGACSNDFSGVNYQGAGPQSTALRGFDMETESERPEPGSGETQASSPVPAGEAEAGNDQPVNSLEEADGTAGQQAAAPRASQAVETRPQAEAAGPSRSVAPRRPSKQPLKHWWSLWFYKNDPLRSWEENLMEVTSFQTLEDFSALYGYIEVASNLDPGCDYCLFKYGIKPMWEDPRNRQGGRWLFSMARSRRASELDSCWLAVMLCLITEEQEFGEFSEDLCGAAVQLRHRADKITVWTADVRRAEANVAIGRALKERLRLNPADKVSYHAHADTRTKKNAGPKAKYRL